jgi:hypothetical protein
MDDLDRHSEVGIVARLLDEVGAQRIHPPPR